MRESDIDGAFEWLVVIIAVLSAIMSQYPEYYAAFLPTPPGFPASLVASRSLVLPLIVTLVIWLTGRIATNPRFQAVFKILAWMYALLAAFANSIGYLLGAEWIPGNASMGVALGNVSLLLVVPAIAYLFIVPKYREMYPEVTLLRSKLLYGALYAAALSLFFLSFGLVGALPPTS